MVKSCMYILNGGLDTEVLLAPPNDPGTGQFDHLFSAINHVAHFCHNVPNKILSGQEWSRMAKNCIHINQWS